MRRISLFVCISIISIALFNVQSSKAFSISNLPDLENEIEKKDTISSDSKFDSSANHTNLDHKSILSNASPTDSLVLHSNKSDAIYQKLSVESNTIATSTDDIKLKDNSDYHEMEAKNRFADLESRKIDEYEFIKDGSSSSPILHFLISKVRPFIEIRIDTMLIKSGFDSNLREKTDIYSQLKINTLNEADIKNIQRATCGQSAEISFTVSDEYGNRIDRDYDDKKLWVNVGQNYMPRGLELGIIGMKIGEVREIIAPSSFNTGTTPLSKKLFLSGKNTLFTVTLHDLKEDEKLDEIRDNLKFYDVLGSVSRRIACLDIVNLDIKVLNGAGEVIYRKPRNKNLRLAIGSGTMPYLEQVLIDSKNYGKRIAFAKTKFLEDLKKSPQLPGLTKVLEENDSVTLELSPSLL